MALSYLSEGEAPRDFRVSSTESDTHYTKCPLCYTVKRNFYCAECVNTGNFMHSSMPYADRFSEKQAKLLRLKANRKHVLDRCEKLLSNKIHKDTLLTEAKIAKDKLKLLRLAIEQRKHNIEEKKKVLEELKQHNNESSLKLPRYQKRVASVETHAQLQQMKLQQNINLYNEQEDTLAALRRSRIRQLTTYIFPVYISYDMSDSIEDMEIVGKDDEEEDCKRSQLHIVATWINTDGDYSNIQNWLVQPQSAAAAAGAAPSAVPAHRVAAALALSAQLLQLLAWTLDTRLPQPVLLDEYCNWRSSACGCAWRARRLRAGCGALAAGALAARGALRPARALAALPALAAAAARGDAALGRRAPPQHARAWAPAWADDGRADDGEPPEHLHWPDREQLEELEELGGSPAGGAASLVTSAAASIASMWRGWTK
ncbi:autophagy related protein 14 [Aphomia sociella]